MRVACLAAPDRSAPVELIDLTNVLPREQDATWKLHAVKLAVDRNVAGRARYVREPAGSSVVVIHCMSTSEPTVFYILAYDPTTTRVVCECRAAQFDRPCSHAGAALLLVTGLAPNDAIVDASVIDG